MAYFETAKGLEITKMLHHSVVIEHFSYAFHGLVQQLKFFEIYDLIKNHYKVITL